MVEPIRQLGEPAGSVERWGLTEAGKVEVEALPRSALEGGVEIEHVAVVDAVAVDEQHRCAGAAADEVRMRSHDVSGHGASMITSRHRKPAPPHTGPPKIRPAVRARS